MGYLLVLFTIILFSTLEVTGKLIGSSISPYAVTLYRFLIGGMLMLPFAIRQKRSLKRKIAPREFLKLSVPGFINVTISMLFLQLAIYYGEANISAVIVSSNSVFVAIFSYFILKEKMTLYKTLGLLLGLTGIVIIIMNHQVSSLDVKNAPLGIIFACIASVTFGLYTTISKKYVHEYGNVLTNTISFLSGAAMLALVSLMFGFDLSFEFTTSNVLLLGYLGVFVTGIAYLTYFAGLKRVSTVAGASFFFLKPAFASILAFFIFEETLSFMQIIGIVIVIIGVNLQVIRDIINRKRELSQQRVQG